VRQLAAALVRRLQLAGLHGALRYRLLGGVSARSASVSIGATPVAVACGLTEGAGDWQWLRAVRDWLRTMGQLCGPTHWF